MDKSSGMIPTILLTGFLGAGKTTLMNRLIDYYNSKNTVLLINEFGQTSIDGQLLKAGSYTKVELNKGSLFCICVRTDFIDEVEKIATDIKPDLLIIEATGIADTSEMEKMLALPNLSAHIEVKSVICIVDCQSFYKIINFLKAPASQVRSADLVLVNKTDLVEKVRVKETIAMVKKINGNATVLTTTYVDFPLEILETFNHPQSNETAEPGEGRPDLVSSLTLQGNGSFTRKNWQEFIESFKNKQLRCKGFITIDKQLYQLDCTTESWQQIESAAQPLYHNQLVIIGQKLPLAQIEDEFYKIINRSE